MGDGIEHFGAEDVGQCLVIEQINLAGLLGFWFDTPQSLNVIHGSGRHDQMHVGMEIEPA